jgi:hypothetical protein
MGETSNREADESQEPGDKKVQVVPVEQLIPEIKPPQERSVEEKGYENNSFDDPFSITFCQDILDEILRHSQEMCAMEKRGGHGTIDFSVLREHMSDQVVVDLGSDTSIVGYDIACLLGAKAYVGVDKYCGGNGPEGIEEKEIGPRIKTLLGGDKKIGELIDMVIKPKAIPASVVKSDMLDFLRRLPDGSVSIFTFGIDDMIIRGRAHREAIKEEIKRVLSSKGGYLTYKSAVCPDKLVNPLEGKLEEGKATVYLTGREAGFFVKE